MAKDERRALLRLRELLMGAGISEQDDLEVLNEAAEQLDGLFMAVVVGEFNAGKSCFINALLGDSYCEEGVVPTTAQIRVLRYVERGAEGSPGRPNEYEAGGAEEVLLPVPWLDDVALVDTPGTNAIIHGHTEITQRVIPRADLVFFVTSADRPFSESERTFLERIRSWRKKVVLVINKIDLFETDAERRQVENFVRINGTALLGASSPVFGISAKRALRAKRAAYPSTDPRMGTAVAAWEASGFEQLEEFVRQELSEESKIRNKLLSPLGVADTIANRAAAKLEERQEIMSSDASLLDMIDEQLTSFMADLKRDTDYEKLHVEKILTEMNRRVDNFLDDKVTITNIGNLMDSERFAAEFERVIAGDTAESIDAVVKYVAELVTKRARAQSAAVMEYIGRRPRHRDSILGAVTTPSPFFHDRDELFARLQHSVGGVWNGVDQHEQMQKIGVAIRGSLAETAAIGAGATTVGGLAVAGVLGDFTGVIATSGLALTGLLILPARRWQQKREFQQKVAELKDSMERALDQHLDRELHRVQDSILEGIAPYRRFVDLETAKLTKQVDGLKLIQRRLKELRSQVG